MCNCKNNYVLRVTSYTYTAGTSLVLNTDNTSTTLYNGAQYLLLACGSLPTMETVVPVYIRIGETNIPLQDVIGNTLYSDQMHPGRRYDLVYGSTPSHFKMRHCCGCSSAISSTTSI